MPSDRSNAKGKATSPVADQLRAVSAALQRSAEALSRPTTPTEAEVSGELDRRALRLGEKRFGEQLAGALAERDTRLIEMEQHATDRYHLLQRASEAARRFESEVQETRASLEVERAARASMRKQLEQAETQLQELKASQGQSRDSIGGSRVEVFREGDALVLVGSGWYGVEKGGDAPFRWVANLAEINVAQLTHAPYALNLEIEPGPAVGAKPFDLGVYEKGSKIATLRVPGRKVVSVELSGGAPSVRQLSLRVENAGPALPTPGDQRDLSYRLFKVELVRKPEDVVRAGQGIRVGTGWYPLESFAGSTFRWAGASATFDLAKAAQARSVKLDVEPGPGVENKPFSITASINDKVLAEVAISGRQSIELQIPPNIEGALQFEVKGGGKPAKNDPRILNFRAFSVSGA